MEVVILVAGYATRMYPLTEHCPKALLPVRGVPILDYILGKVFALAEPPVARVTLVSNHRFYGHFVNWQRWRRPPVPVAVLDDGSTSDENRLGALGDLWFAVQQQKLDDTLLVLAGDNLFSFDLGDLVRLSEAKGADAVVVRRLDDEEARKRTGIAELDAQGRLISFEEKPSRPRSCWAVPPIYCYRRQTIGLLGQYLCQGGKGDSPGQFLVWLHSRVPVYGLKVSGSVLDVGSKDTYAAAQQWLDERRLAEFGFRPW